MERKESKYLVVKQAIKEQIENGTLKVNDKLPTEAEYVELFQVSTITVRRALTELADEGYVKRLKHKGTFVTSPSSSPSASRLIALILYSEDRKDSSYIHIIRGAQTMASSFNYSLIVEWHDGNVTNEINAIRKMLNLNVEGLLIYSFDPSKSIANYRYLESRKIPFVLLDRYELDYPCYFSGCNNYDGGILATQFLIRQKHQKIRFSGYKFFLKSEQERYDGFCSAMRQAGLAVSDDSLLLDVDYDDLARQIRVREVTAIFCCNDRHAVQMMERLRERGVAIPQDVSIMGFDDWRASPTVDQELTTVLQDFNKIGQNAAYLLFSLLQGKLAEEPIKLLTTPSLVIRSSVQENL